MCAHHHKIATGKYFRFKGIYWLSAVEFRCADCGTAFWYPSQPLVLTAMGKNKAMLFNTGQDGAAWQNEF